MSLSDKERAVLAAAREFAIAKESGDHLAWTRAGGFLADAALTLLPEPSPEQVAQLARLLHETAGWADATFDGAKALLRAGVQLPEDQS